eukprot:1942025-Rhodomonas_salina.2
MRCRGGGAGVREELSAWLLLGVCDLPAAVAEEGGGSQGGDWGERRRMMERMRGVRAWHPVRAERV